MTEITTIPQQLNASGRTFRDAADALRDPGDTGAPSPPPSVFYSPPGWADPAPPSPLRYGNGNSFDPFSDQDWGGPELRALFAACQERAAEMASIGTGLEQLAARVYEVDTFPAVGRLEPYPTTRSTEDALIGDFVLGDPRYGTRSALKEITDLGKNPKYSDGFGRDVREGGYQEVETPYGMALQRGVDRAWFVKGSDGLYYRLDRPAYDAASYGYERKERVRGVIDTGWSPSMLDRVARVLAMGAGPNYAGPDTYRYLDWGNTGKAPTVGKKVDPAMEAGPPDIPRHSVPTDAPKNSEDLHRGDMIAGGFGIAVQGLSDLLDDNAKYAGVQITFSADAKGRRRAVVQTAQIDSARGVQTSWVSGFDDDGDPVLNNYDPDDGFTFDLTEASQCGIHTPKKQKPAGGQVP